MRVLLFSNIGCGPCMAAESQLKSNGIEFEKILYSENIEIFEKHSVQSVPTVCVLDVNDNHLFSQNGIPVNCKQIKEILSSTKEG